MYFFLDKKGKLFIVYTIFYLFLLLGQRKTKYHHLFFLFHFYYNHSGHKIIFDLYIDKEKLYFQVHYSIIFY
jgi:hypothetical protein